MKIVVLGAGPVGFAVASILRADCIVGEKLGGSWRGGNNCLRNLAPIYLWRTPRVCDWLKSLNVDFEPRTMKFGWLVHGGLTSVPSDGDLRSYYHRSRDAIFIRGVPDYVASSGKWGELEICDFNFDDLVLNIFKRTEFVGGRVTNVDVGDSDSSILISTSTSKNPIIADVVVNTLPAPIWDDLVKRNGIPVWGGIYPVGWKSFVRGEAWDVRLEEEYTRGRERKKFLYVSDPHVPFDRVKFRESDAENDRFVYEFNRITVPQGFERDVNGEFLFAERIQVKGTPRDETDWNGRVIHLGRFARWDSSIRIHDVVERTMRLVGVLRG